MGPRVQIPAIQSARRPYELDFEDFGGTLDPEIHPFDHHGAAPRAHGVGGIDVLEQVLEAEGAKRRGRDSIPALRARNAPGSGLAEAKQVHVDQRDRPIVNETDVEGRAAHAMRVEHAETDGEGPRERGLARAHGPAKAYEMPGPQQAAKRSRQRFQLRFIEVLTGQHGVSESSRR